MNHAFYALTLTGMEFVKYLHIDTLLHTLNKTKYFC